MIWVGIGGMLGAITRFLLGKWITGKISSPFPWGTWLINVSGSFALGMVAVLYTDGGITESLWLFWGIGFLGSYTTFSTFGYEAIGLAEKQEWKKACLYVVTSVVLGIVMAWMGGNMANTFYV